MILSAHHGTSDPSLRRVVIEPNLGMVDEFDKARPTPLEISNRFADGTLGKHSLLVGPIPQFIKDGFRFLGPQSLSPRQ